MTILEQAHMNGVSPAWIAIIAVVGIAMLFVGLKIGRMIAKLALGLIGLALLGGLVWWFFLRH